MCLLHVIPALILAALASPAPGVMPLDELYAKALEDDVKGKPREYQPHEWAFGSQCKGVRIIGHGIPSQTTLQATCVDEWGARWLTALNLNRCLSNVYGRFVYYPGANQEFDASCTDCRLFHSDTPGQLLFACSCGDDKCEARPAAAQLGGGDAAKQELYLKPADGRFVCGREKGSKEFVMNGSVARDD